MTLSWSKHVKASKIGENFSKENHDIAIPGIYQVEQTLLGYISTVLTRSLTPNDFESPFSNTKA